MLRIVYVLSCFIPTAILWACTTVMLMLEMKKFDIGKADFLKDTLLLPLRRRGRNLPQAFGYKRWCFHLLHYLWKVVVYKNGQSSISTPNSSSRTLNSIFRRWSLFSFLLKLCGHYDHHGK